jgi:hypothetical protein
MAEANFRLIGSIYCSQYKTIAELFIDGTEPSGQRQLIVRYASGGYQGRPQFATVIPKDWSEKDIKELILMKASQWPYPSWEVPQRAYGSAELFHWWKIGKPR